MCDIDGEDDDVEELKHDGLAADHDDPAEDDDDGVEEGLDDKPMKVQNGLYIGSYMAEMNKNSLLAQGITDILQVAQGLFPHHPLMFNYMNIQVQDLPSEDLVQYFPKCFEFIDRAISKGGAVLVHCAAGVSRSATIVLGYLMSHYHMDLSAAVDHLKAIRPWVCPNGGFIKQLETYQGLAHDMSKWRAWHLVWGEQQQQQQHQHQQQWLQLPQGCRRIGLTQQQQQQQQPNRVGFVNGISCYSDTIGCEGTPPTGVAAAAAAACNNGMQAVTRSSSSAGCSSSGSRLHSFYGSDDTGVCSLGTRSSSSWCSGHVHTNSSRSSSAVVAAAMTAAAAAEGQPTKRSCLHPSSRDRERISEGISQQQQQQQVELAEPARRHVAFTLSAEESAAAASPLPAAAATVVDAEMEEAVAALHFGSTQD